MTEASRSLVENLGLSEGKAAYRESEIRRYFLEAGLIGYEELIPATFIANRSNRRGVH
jgi:hypothetical protein